MVSSLSARCWARFDFLPAHFSVMQLSRQRRGQNWCPRASEQLGSEDAVEYLKQDLLCPNSQVILCSWTRQEASRSAMELIARRWVRLQCPHQSQCSQCQ